jgi:hypothetical protein
MSYKTIIDYVPTNVTLVAVSKTKPVEAINAIYNQGHRHFGENKVQELVEKQALLPKDIKWHLIGHLQTNKVKFIAPFIHLIHAIDSLKLLKEINKEAKKNDRIINCLLQFYIAEEETKFGLSFDEVKKLLESTEFSEMQNIQIAGVMAIASNTEDVEQVRNEFSSLEGYFQILKSHYFKFNSNFNEISMGMSNDYKLAIEQGSTMLRIGSAIFGER